jgi:predicted solute-binding protein
VAKRLGIIAHRYAQPLFEWLRTCNEPLFEIVEDTAAQLAMQLRQQQLDGAFLSPIDYAKDYSHSKIIPDVAAVSEGESGVILMLFHEQAREIRTLAANPAMSSEIVLASIILSEKFDTKVSIVPSIMPVEESLQRADAYLAVGDIALALRDRTNKLDLVDEWKDVTEMPFVHGMWVVREGGLTDQEIGAIRTSSLQAEENLSGTSQSTTYKFDERAVAALNEFYRMAYYHGILKDIPDVKFTSQ